MYLSMSTYIEDRTGGDCVSIRKGRVWDFVGNLLRIPVRPIYTYNNNL